MMDALVTNTRAAAASIGQQVEVFAASASRDIDAAFASLTRQPVGVLLVSPDPLFDSRRSQLVTLAARHVVPTMYPFRECVEAGGLMSYGTNFIDIARLSGTYTARVLKGEKPADLPVLQATKFEFVVNLQTAKMIGVIVPPMLLARAVPAQLVPYFAERNPSYLWPYVCSLKHSRVVLIGGQCPCSWKDA